MFLSGTEGLNESNCFQGFISCFVISVELGINIPCLSVCSELKL